MEVFTWMTILSLVLLRKNWEALERSMYFLEDGSQRLSQVTEMAEEHSGHWLLKDFFSLLKSSQDSMHYFLKQNGWMVGR